MASAGSVTLAGCQRSGSSDTTQVNGDPAATTYQVPITGHATSEESIQFNIFNITNQPWFGSQCLLFAYLSWQSAADFAWQPFAARRMDISDEVWEIELIDSLEWHNGDPLDADDLARQFKLSAFTEQRAVGNYIEDPADITVTGDHTVAIQLDDTYNPDSLKINVLTQNPIMAPEPVFGEYLERFQDASTNGETQSVRQELTQFNWEDPGSLTSGPLSLEAITSQGIRLRPYSEWPIDAIQSNIQRNTDTTLPAGGYDFDLEGQFYSDHNSVTQAVISGGIDGGAGISAKSQADLDRYPESGEVRLLKSGSGISIIFNMIDDEHADAWRDQRVRKAFAHIIDLDGVAEQFFGEFVEHSGRFSGLIPKMDEKLFDDAFLNSLRTYEQDFEKARSLLQEAGFSQNSKGWRTPDGEAFTPKFVGPTSVQYYLSGFQVAVSNLKEFGINAELNAIEGTSFFSRTLSNMEYGLTRGYYSHSVTPLAWRRSWVRYGGPEEHEYSAYLQQPFDSTVVEVPPIGEPESDETIEIDILERYDAVRRATDQSEIIEISKELAWAFNQTVPRLPVSPQVQPFYFEHDDWEYADSDDPMGQYPLWLMPQYGGIAEK
jgi:peptide/nickel transport system substrate-binding protein